MTSTGLSGLILVDKPQGWTSHDVVAKLRRIAGQRRIGHTGTLDPMATGLLVLCLGNATRLVEYIAGHDKRYEGEITLGQTTDTDDAEGKVVATAPVDAIGAEVRRTLEQQFTGELLQVPPAHSAISVGGQRAYRLARAGEPLTMAPRPVVVHRLELAQSDATHLRIAVHCGPGTYIRSLARDIGATLGCGGHLSALRRVSAGRFSVADARSLDELEALGASGGLAEALVPADEGVGDAPAAIVTEAHADLLRHGGQFTAVPPALEAPEPARIYSASGEFVAIGSVAPGGLVRAIKVLV